MLLRLLSHPNPRVINLGNDDKLSGIILAFRVRDIKLLCLEVNFDMSVLFVELAGIEKYIVQDLLVKSDVDQKPILLYLVNHFFLAVDVSVQRHIKFLLVNVLLEQSNEVFQGLKRVLDAGSMRNELVLLDQGRVQHRRIQQFHHF